MRPLRKPVEWLRTLILAAALAWAVAAFGQEVLRFARSEPPGPGAPPSFWTLGSPVVEPLAELLTDVDRSLAPSQRVAFASDLSPAEDFFLSMWCAYLLPRHDLVRAFHQPGLPEARVLITVGRPVEALDLPGVAARATIFKSSLQARPPVFVYRLEPPVP